MYYQAYTTSVRYMCIYVNMYMHTFLCIYLYQAGAFSETYDGV